MSGAVRFRGVPDIPGYREPFCRMVPGWFPACHNNDLSLLMIFKLGLPCPISAGASFAVCCLPFALTVSHSYRLYVIYAFMREYRATRGAYYRAYSVL